MPAICEKRSNDGLDGSSICWEQTPVYNSLSRIVSIGFERLYVLLNLAAILQFASSRHNRISRFLGPKHAHGQLCDRKCLERLQRS